MDRATVDKRFLKVQKRMAILAGVWPFQMKKQKYLCLLLLHLILLTCVIPQLARVVIFYSIDILLEECPYISAVLGIYIKQFNYIIYGEQLKILLEGLYSDWAVKRTEGETAVLTKYAERGVFFTFLYLLNVYFCFSMYIGIACVPRVMDLIFPLNTSRSYIFIYPAYYGVDEEKYYYPIFGHMLIAITIVAVVFISCDTLFMYTVQHTCGLLAVAGYRFKNAMQSIDSGDNKDEKSAMKTYKAVCFSVMGHQRAFDYFVDIRNAHLVYLFICVGIIMIAFSITMVKASSMDPSMELYKYVGFLIVQLIHLLFITIQGQFILNSYDQIFHDIYHSLWYNVNSKSQLLFVFALRRSLTPPLLTAGGLMTLNLQNFAEILKASFSYFTVLKS